MYVKARIRFLLLSLKILNLYYSFYIAILYFSCGMAVINA